jgi:hypothetical protein
MIAGVFGSKPNEIPLSFRDRKGCLSREFDFYLKIRIKREQGERFTVASVERDTRPKRETLGLQHGHVLLTHLIERIHQPAARWIEMKRSA